MVTLFILLVVFQLKHFLADYPLQGQYMLGKFKGGTDWILPLAAHAGVHFLFTFVIVLAYNKNIQLAVLLGVLDFGLHFIMDRIKASPEMLGKYKAISGSEYQYIQMKQMPLMTITYDGDNHKRSVDAVIHVLTEKEVKEKLDNNRKFWLSLGLDQMVHHLTHYIIIAIMVNV